MKDVMAYFPENIQGHSRFDEAGDTIRRVVKHRALRLGTTRLTIQAMLASLFFAGDFQATLKAATGHALGLYRPSVFSIVNDAFVARILMELSMEELADKLPDGSYGPHYVMMLDAAKQGGADTSGVETYFNSLELPLTRFKVAEVELAQELGMCQEIVSYLTYRTEVVRDPLLSATDIALRELTLPFCHRELLESLSEGEWTEKYRHYLSMHIDLDESGHRPLMTRLLERIPKGEPLDRTMEGIIRSYTHRGNVLNACLRERPIY